MLFNSILRPKLLNIPLASYFLINLDFLAPHIVHIDNIIVLPLLVSEIVWFTLSLFFLHFKQEDNIVLYFRL